MYFFQITPKRKNQQAIRHTFQHVVVVDLIIWHHDHKLKAAKSDKKTACCCPINEVNQILEEKYLNWFKSW